MIAGALLFTIRSGAVALLQRRAVSAKSKSIFRCRRRRSPRRRRPLRGSGNTAPAPEAVATNNRGGRRIPGGSGGDRGRDSCRVPGAAVRCRLSRPAGRWPRLRRHRGRTIRDRSAKGRSRQARTSSDGIRSRLSAEDLGRSAPLRGRREHSSAYWRAPSGSVGKGLPTYDSHVSQKHPGMARESRQPREIAGFRCSTQITHLGGWIFNPPTPSISPEYMPRTPSASSHRECAETR